MTREIYVKDLFKKVRNAICAHDCFNLGEPNEEFLKNGNSIYVYDIENWLDEYNRNTNELDELKSILEEEYNNDVEIITTNKAVERFNEIMLHHEVAHEVHDKEMIDDFDEEDFVMGKARFLAEQYSDKVDVWGDEFDEVCKLVKPLQGAFENNEITEEEAISKFKEIVTPFGFEFEILEEIDAFENFGDEFTKFVFLQGRH